MIRWLVLPQSIRRIVIVSALWTIGIAVAIGFGLAMLPIWMVIVTTGVFGFCGMLLLMPWRVMAYLIPFCFAFPVTFELPNGATIDSLDVVLVIVGLRLLTQATRGKAPRLYLTNSTACTIAFINLTVLALSLFSEYDPARTIWKIYKEARIPSFFFIAFLVLRSKRDILAQMYALIASAMLTSVHGILQTVSGDPYFLIPIFFLSGAWEADSQIGIYRHLVPGSTLVRAHSFHLFHNVFAGFVMISISVSLALLIMKEGRTRDCRSLFIFIIIQIAGFLATFSRGAWVCFVIAWILAVLILGLIQRARPVKILAVTAFTALIALCVLALVFHQAVLQRITTILKPTQQSEFWFRVIRWQSALSVISRQPILGTGRFNIEDSQAELPVGATPHNGYLFIAVSRGLPALICFLLILIYAVRCSVFLFQKKDWRLRTLGLATFTSLIGFAIHNFWDATIGDFAVGGLFWWMAGAVSRACGGFIEDNENAG